MGHEGISSGTSSDGLGAILEVMNLAGEVADNALSLIEPVEKAGFVQWLRNCSLAKAVRIGALALSVLPAAQLNQSEGKFEKSFQIVEVLVREAGKATGEQLLQHSQLPGPEQFQSILARAAVTIQELTRRVENGSPTEKAAMAIVIANVMEIETSPVLRTIFNPDQRLYKDAAAFEKAQSDSEHFLQDSTFKSYEDWSTQVGVVYDFEALYKSPMMVDVSARSKLTEEISNIYRSEKIKGLQGLVQDSRILQNFEVIFRAVNTSGFKESHQEDIKNAAQELLQAGVLEKVVVALVKSKADIDVRGLVDVLSPYVPRESLGKHEWGERVPLQEIV